jgi:hypothetical protein
MSSDEGLAMKMREFTSITQDDGDRIFRVAARISDHPDRAEQSEWIEFQLAIDAPTIRNGAILRREALEKARDVLDQLAKNFQRLADRVR